MLNMHQNLTNAKHTSLLNQIRDDPDYTQNFWTTNYIESMLV